MSDQDAIARFHAIWDGFSERARLIREDRTVLAINSVAEREGLTTGVRCIDAPPSGSHAGCRANLALRDGCAQYDLSVNGKRMRFWIPMDGCEDLYVHFSLPIH
ncbi:hypothetical protein LJC33_07485 [Eubacteriales bacterium OttesenSCG-928-N13]|nr:hypothetical protein [Eubacteriales bacterium OttesenSCG-928-N13]